MGSPIIKMREQHELVAWCEIMEQNIETLKNAAEQGDAEALYQLGNCYQNGEGVEQDIEKAIEWWLKAADLGHEKASELIQKLSLIMKLI